MTVATAKQTLNQQLDDLLSLRNIHGTKGTDGNSERIVQPRPNGSIRKPDAPIEFSVIFFSDVNQALGHKYQLVFDITQFADQQGFTAAWMPERHFHPFGGIYPNPATLAAALAVKTEQIRLRSGSVVLPLHHPVEVVESWAMVDNLSNGRVDLGFASGWNPNDFLLSPETYANRRGVWQDRIPIVQKLWRGEPMTFDNGKGEPATIQVYPRPIQPELAVWFVISKADESFIYAGSQGYNVLTMLQGIDLDEMGRKIQLYRDARREHGFDADAGVVTLMLHTLVHKDRRRVEEAVREPFFDYIKSALRGHIQVLKAEERPSEEELNKIVDYSYERYFKTGALFGSVASTQQVVDKAIAIGVNEIACLMDFGTDYSIVMESLDYLAGLTERY